MAMASRYKLKYHQWLFVVLLLFFWAFVACFMGFQYLREKQFKIETVNTQLQHFNESLIEDLNIENVENIDIDKIKKPFKDLRITIISITGDVLYDNSIDIHKLDNHKHRPEIEKAIIYGFGYSIDRISDSDSIKYFYSATRNDDLIVRTAIPYSVLLQDLLKADMTFVWIVVIIALIGSALGYIVIGRLGKTISRLNQFAENAEKGVHIYEHEQFPHDELGEISNHIVSLYTRLQNTIEERDREHKLAIAQEQDKIRIKRQLTNNINHELKTPVASIQVCLETLLSGTELPDEKIQELMSRCYSNCERLCSLLNDVSLITRMEDGGQLITKESVIINDIILDVINDLKIQYYELNMKIHVDFLQIVNLCGNQSLLASIFRNLIDNSISYSGGKNIYIKLLDNNSEKCLISFEDDGIGVEDAHLPLLFERFYRIDKGRSRKMGGTGLGLSIVKHAVLFHGGSITVENGNKGGLCFVFTLMKK